VIDYLGSVGGFLGREPAREELHPYPLGNSRGLDIVPLFQFLGGLGLPSRVVLLLIWRSGKNIADASHIQS
jgi:hypothetical protein